MIYAVLIILGLCFGSFVNALVWRVRHNETSKKKISIINDRSMCPRCKHTLGAADLVPLLSWLFLKGKCRYCGKPISPQYPLVELSMTLVFVLSYVYWPAALTGGQTALFAAWLAAGVGLMALLVYDLKWMLLPNRIIYPTLLAAGAGNIIYLAGFAPDKVHFLLYWALSVVIASGVFWALYSVSDGKWIGFGDVRLGLITGTLLQTPGKSILMIFLASLAGAAVSLPLIAVGKSRLSSKIPYGPFLIGATFICLLFGQEILDWYKHLAGY
ncbi:MAG TPA: prepilin peptidase [Candidatus Saccharimonadales bacterium]|nr:prepilin peptidase [Candidatus Saccharimonadales bacterium]